MKNKYRIGHVIAKALLSFTLACGMPIYLFELSAAVEKRDKITVADQLLEQNQNIEGEYCFEFRGRQYIGYPNVYSPVIFPGANKQTSIVLHGGEHFLELGCGTGIFSVTAALQGAEQVVAIDVNPDAVLNTLENARLHGVDDRVIAIQGDMFQPLQEGQLFDVIFFNIPFCHRNCAREELTMLARSLFDPEHELLHCYFREGKQYLTENGRMILGYSTTHGDIELMREWANKYDWDILLLHKVGDEIVDFITVEMYEFRPK